MWSKDLKIGTQAIDVRLTTAVTKPVSAVPAKMPFYVTREDGVPLNFADLWERWKDGMLSCTTLTADAADGIRDLHK
jgi:putative SOS response-associated peptidase YedK